MSNPKRIRFGLIGAGAIAGAYSDALQKTACSQLVAVVDTDPEAARRLAARHDAAVFDTVENFREQADIDAAIVCTPPLYHPRHCTGLLRRGTHVLCEKPLALDSASAAAMVEAASVGGALFTMASKFRFVEDINVAKKFLDDGKLGEIVLYENCFTGVVDMSQRWNSDPAISGGGVLIDNGTHSLDIMRYLLGNLAEIRVVEGHRIQALPVEDTVHVFVRSQMGAIGSIDLSWSLHKDVPYFVSLYGSQGTIQVGWRGSRYKLAGDSQWTTFGTGYNKVDAFKRQIENFSAAIGDNQPLLIEPEDGVASVCAVEAAYAAMKKSHWQPVSMA